MPSDAGVDGGRDGGGADVRQDSQGDGDADAIEDAYIDAPVDVSTDVTVDVTGRDGEAVDALGDAPEDVHLDVPMDATADALSDVVDTGADGENDAPTDAAADLGPDLCSDVVCVADSVCHDIGVCDPSSGVCSHPLKPDGALCDDGDACTQADACQTGACVGADPFVCVASDVCHVPGVCDPSSGICSSETNAPDGTECDDGDACTSTDTCQAGTCMSGPLRWTWQTGDLPPLGAPPTARSGHTAIYDSANERMIVFGGRDAAGYLNDVWELSLPAGGTPSWTELSPAGTSPASRVLHTAIYDDHHQRMIVFGGFRSDLGVSNDVWGLSLSTSGPLAWTDLTPPGSMPSARSYHTAIHDSANERMIVFGGSLDDDVWALSLADAGTLAWTEIVPVGTGPPGAVGHSAVYDAVNQRMVVYSWPGVFILSLPTAANTAWAELLPAGPEPEARYRHRAVFDEARQQMIAFGGWSSGALDDVVVLSFDDGGISTWSTPSVIGAPPSPRHDLGMIRIDSHRSLIFGGGQGLVSPILSNDVFVLSSCGD